MDRLTILRNDGRYALEGGGTTMERIMKFPAAIDRLAAYDDTALATAVASLFEARRQSEAVPAKEAVT